MNNRVQIFTPNSQGHSYGYINPYTNQTFLDSGFQQRIPINTVVNTAGGLYKLTANGSQRVGAAPQSQSVNFMSQNQMHANNMRQLQNQTLNSAIAQNNFATQQRMQAYHNQTRGIRQNAEEQARQAYIQRLRSMNNLPRLLRAQGITGGAAESTVARTSSNFDNLQFGIMQNRDNALFDIQNRISQANAAGAQNEATLRGQHIAQQMQLEQNLENQRIQAADRDFAEWNRQRNEMIATLPQFYNDFQAQINNLQSTGDPYNLIPHLQILRNEKIRNQDALAAAEAEAQASAQDDELRQFIRTLDGLPSYMLERHLEHYTPNGWAYNVIRALLEQTRRREADEIRRQEAHYATNEGRHLLNQQRANRL